jgi:subtilisin family serine protease
MNTLIARRLITLSVCIFLLVSTVPVLAQGEIATDTPATETQPVEQTATPEDMLTETATSEITTPTDVFSATPELSETPTASPTLPSATPTRAAATSTLVPACSMSGVFDNQITVGYTSSKIPGIAQSYSVVDQFTDADGNKVGVIEVSSGDFCAVLSGLRQNASVKYAEPNYAISKLDTVPNDPYLSNQYYLNNILAPEGWDYTTGSSAVILAIIDSGVDEGNPDLASKLTAGYDFVENDTDPHDENGHGTVVAGIAAANSNNGYGVAGVSWGAQIMPVRVLDAYGNGSYANAAAGILWATNHGARVINLSLGGSNYSQVLADAVSYAVEQGVVVVAASGNSGSNKILYPAALPGVIAVGATNSANQLASFSNTGAEMDVVAPGVSIFGLRGSNGYTYSSGTSDASPQVAGYAALLFSVPGVVYSSQVVDLIDSTALDLGATGWDSSYGYGLIQIGPGLQKALGGTPTATSTPHKVYPTAAAPTATPTATRVWYGPLSPTMTSAPFGPTMRPGEPTPTQGEVYMLGGASLTETATISQPGPAGVELSPTLLVNETNPAQAHEFPWWVVGLSFIMISAGIYIYVSRRK